MLEHLPLEVAGHTLPGQPRAGRAVDADVMCRAAATAHRFLLFGRGNAAHVAPLGKAGSVVVAARVPDRSLQGLGVHNPLDPAVRVDHLAEPDLAPAVRDVVQGPRPQETVLPVAVHPQDLLLPRLAHLVYSPANLRYPRADHPFPGGNILGAPGRAASRRASTCHVAGRVVPS